MDAHFREYLAAVAAMADLYGESGDDHPTEFHDAVERERAVDAVPCGCATFTTPAA